MNRKPYLPVDLIFVPQGFEYRAVCRGLKQIDGVCPPVVPILIGCHSLTNNLTWTWKDGFAPRVLLMGLCGGLQPQWKPGSVVLYQSCVDGALPGQRRFCDVALTASLHERLPKAEQVVGLTSDRPIWSSAEKQDLGQRYQADIVDMEGFAALGVLQANGVEVAMVRVVSDGCRHDLPDLNGAIDAGGSLRPLRLALSFLKQPIAAARLIRGSLTGLDTLQKVTTQLFAREG